MDGHGHDGVNQFRSLEREGRCASRARSRALVSRGCRPGSMWQPKPAIVYDIQNSCVLTLSTVRCGRWNCWALLPNMRQHNSLSRTKDVQYPCFGISPEQEATGSNPVGRAILVSCATVRARRAHPPGRHIPARCPESLPSPPGKRLS